MVTRLCSRKVICKYGTRFPRKATPVLLLLTTMIGLGLIAGALAGGTIRGLKGIHFRLVWLLFVSAAIALLPLFSHFFNRHKRVFVLIELSGVLIFLIVNIVTSHGLFRTGLGLALVGLALNFVVIAANGGMPLSMSAYRSSGQTDAITQGSGGFYRIVLATSRTKLRPLGDVIPIRPYREVLSIGDVLLILGVALVIVGGMRSIGRGTPAEAPAQ